MTLIKGLAVLVVSAVLSVPVGCCYVASHWSMGIASGVAGAMFSPLLLMDPPPGVWKAIATAFVMIFMLIGYFANLFKPADPPRS
jgi:hypothetical protein